MLYLFFKNIILPVPSLIIKKTFLSEHFVYFLLKFLLYFLYLKYEMYFVILLLSVLEGELPGANVHPPPHHYSLEPISLGLLYIGVVIWEIDG